MSTVHPGLSHPEPLLTPLQRIGFTALTWFLFILHSRLFDLGLWWLHIPSLVLGLSIAIACTSRGLLLGFVNRTGAVLLLLTVWMCFSTAFSVWRGGSVNTLIQWLKSVLVYFVVAALIRTWPQYRKTYYVLAISVLVLALTSLAFGQPNADGRLALGRGRFGNPNDLAQILLMSLPFWYFIATRPGARASRRALAWLASGPIFVTIALTGSRGALIATGGLLLVLFVRSSMKHKLQLALAGLVLFVCAAVTLPASLQRRYFTFFRTGLPQDTYAIFSAPEAEDTATRSTESRWALLRDSLILTARHPVFGVGTGVFDVAQDRYSRETHGVRGGWQHTHNSYTEMSSENGIPALLLYLLLMVLTWRAARIKRPRGAVLSPRQADIAAAATALRLSLFTFCLSALFGSFAYHPQLLVLAGLAIALKRIAAFEFPNSSSAVVLPAWAPARAKRAPIPA